LKRDGGELGFTCLGDRAKQRVMMAVEAMVYGLAGLAVAGFVCHALGHWFASEARERRKRRRNYGRVIARSKRPMVMLSVRTGKA
jgi:hypothetical protein